MNHFTSSKKSNQWLSLNTFATLILYFGIVSSVNAYDKYNSTAIYESAGTLVVYSVAKEDGGYTVGVFKNGWYVPDNTPPAFTHEANGWKLQGEAVEVNNLTDEKGSSVPAPKYATGASYPGGSIVKKYGFCYRNKWWSSSDPVEGSPWESVDCPAAKTVDNPWVSASTPTPNSDTPIWDSRGVYLEGSVVQYGGICFRAQWWTSGNTPQVASTLKNVWDSPWKEVSDCTQTIKPVAIVPSDTTENAKKETENKENTIAVPPTVVTDIKNPSVPISNPAPISLPADGYAFLRKVTYEDWDWMFPFRSGKYTTAGGTRNAPPIAKADGSTDTFTLNSFIRAVLEYNNWAKENKYKQFLNEGTLKQQAEEFLAFWAKSSRETSGSWDNAPEPWVVKDVINSEQITTWKGGLYWVEEVGYSTNSDGTSVAVNYVDGASTDFPPSAQRSYYGRGVIQLSWNYNYGAFSYWMYDNGLFSKASDSAGKCVINYRKKLLDYPNLVAECGDLSILSGIWFWMTPQGAKPAAQDVLLGKVSNISTRTQ